MGKWQETVGEGFGTGRRFHPGAKRKRVVVNENDGKPGGYHVEHFDGSQDAVVQPRTVELGLTVKGER